MLKGTVSKVFLNITELNPTSKTSNSSHQVVHVKDTVVQKISTNPSIRLSTGKPSLLLKLENQTIRISKSKATRDSIFIRSEAREKAIQAQKVQHVTVIRPVSLISDTTFSSINPAHIPFQNQVKSVLPDLHKNIYLTISDNGKPGQIKTEAVTEIKNQQLHALTYKTKPQGYKGNARIVFSLDWLPGVLLLSLFTFSWIKVIYNKYVLQIFYSLVNYQASFRLFRERSVLFRNVSYGLDIIFALNTGLFVYFLFDFFHVSQIKANSFISFILYSLMLLIFFNAKFLICKFIGFLFMAKDTFEEYIHNENLSNKNIGLLLFPIVILIPYVPEFMKPSVIYTGITIVGVLILLRIFRGFQIIIRKEVTSFYLILYLCAIEILPLLILVKYSGTLI